MGAKEKKIEQGRERELERNVEKTGIRSQLGATKHGTRGDVI